MSHPHKSLQLVALVAASIFSANCDSTSPIGPVSAIRKAVTPPSTATVGSTLTGGVTVQVVDARGHAVTGARIQFTVTVGDGTVTPDIVLSDGGGLAHTDWTISQTAGDNILVVKSEATDSTAMFTVTGVAAPATALAVTPHILRLPSGTTSGTVAGAIVDQFGNKVAGTATYTSRNPALVTVDANTGAVNVVAGSSGTTYIVATGSTFKDSTYVIVLKSTDLPCTGIATRATMAVGDVITTGFTDNGVCVDGTTSGGEFALVPYFNSAVPSAGTALSMAGYGIKVPGPLGDASLAGTKLLANAIPSPSVSRAALNATAFHDRLRATEAMEMPAAAQNARLWYGAQRSAHRAYDAAVPVVGALMQLNVNPNDYCSNATMHTARVAAITQRTVVMADTSNPPGFTDAEYQAFGTTFDTLVYALDVSNFGEPSDIDNNGGRIILLFTHAVNEVGPGVLGFYYGRDLLPKLGPLGSCPGSNVSEIMYLAVPGATGYTTDFVNRNTIGTAAHEFQHLINAARRMYVNTDAAPTEERWLNEGLSHIAEELMFYRTSGLSPRHNLGSAELRPTPDSLAYILYQSNNFARLKYYLATPESQAPVGINDEDDDFATRGAIWSFLRYAADQRFAQTEPTLWHNLVNSNETGLQNLYATIGTDTRLMMRDWTLSIFLDDLLPGINPKYQQPSWNSRQAMGFYSPATKTLPNGSATTYTLQAGGTTFARFAIAAGGEAYVNAAGLAGTALPKNVLLALVRTK